MTENEKSAKMERIKILEGMRIWNRKKRQHFLEKIS